jgi:hypothetical protein
VSDESLDRRHNRILRRKKSRLESGIEGMVNVGESQPAEGLRGPRSIFESADDDLRRHAPCSRPFIDHQ